MSSVFGISKEDIKDDASPDNIESWDSLKHMNLIVALEEEFDLEIPDKISDEIKTVGEAIDYIYEEERKL